MKNLKYVIITVVAMFISINNINAASGSITATSSTKTAVVGSTFSVTVKVSCTEALGSWQFGISYDSQYISLVSGDTNVASYGDGSTKTKSYTYKFKAIKSGSAKVRINGASMVSWNDVDTLFTPSTSSASITVKTQAEIEASYSKDNNLKSLSVDGYELTPAFSSSVTEYTLEVPEDVTVVNVSAKVNDSTATVRGIGNIDLSEGSNKVEVVVTAQNGSTKTYIINITVKDLNPITVTIDNETYTIVKKTSLLTAPTGFSDATIQISGIEVPAFTSEITKFTLVGLKDSAGNIALFIYDSEKNEYKKYSEIQNSSISLYPLSIEEIPEGFDSSTITINGSEYPALKSVYSENFYLIYAMNIEDGQKNYYIYDTKNNSFVLYDSQIFETFKNENREYILYIIALVSVASILLLISLMQAKKVSKFKKMIIKLTDKKEKNDNIVEEDISSDEFTQEEIVNESLENADINNNETIVEKKKKKKRK